MANVKFTYLYRDGSNYKSWGEVIFSNPESVTPEQVEHRLHKSLMSDATFVANQVRVPEVFPYGDTPDEDDHCLHEFDSVENTPDPANDFHHRTIGDFLDEIDAAAQKGWMGFDPQTRTTFRFVL